MNNLYWVITPQHTGTWFFLRFLDSLQQTKGIFTRSKLIEAFELKEWIITPKSIIHAHIAHVVDSFVLIANTAPLISMRDPLAAIISKLKRYPEFEEETNMIDVFVSMAKILPKLDAPFKISCIDLIKPENRLESLLGILEWFSLEDEPKKLKNWAEKWPKYPCWDYELKTKYFEGDIDFLKRFIPKAWEQITKEEEVLRPWLEDLGYSNLLWWS